MTDFTIRVRERLAAALPELDAAAIERLPLQAPRDPGHGDLALPCFALAKALGKAPPAIAAELAGRIEPDDVIAEATAAGPFLNFRLQRATVAREVLTAVLEKQPPYGPAPPSGRTVVIDFSSPNIAKPFHMGHLRSTVIGAALRRMHRHAGDEVHGINHLGDWGMPFARMMTAYMRWGNADELHADPMRYMFDLYVRYGRAEDREELDREAAAHFRALESGEENEERRMWRFLRDESLKAFQGPYERLGVDFDHVTGESFYEQHMESVFERCARAGVLEVSDGAEVIDLSDQGIAVPCILRKSDGTTLYHTRDLAAAFYREATFHPDRILYVVGAEQKLHFRQLQAALRRMREPLAEKIEHVPFGLILARNPVTEKWEKFASRGGNAIFLDEVLDEAVANVRRIIAEKNPDLEDPDAVAEQVGVSAIVFNDLRSSRIRDVKFDQEAMLSFEGETGPYVQYAHARLCSILRKAGAGDVDPARVDFGLLADAEGPLNAMLEFGPALERGVRESEPSVVTGLMIRLAGEIHSYLREHRVIDAEAAVKEARLALVRAARDVLAAGLGLIGVAAPERM